MYHLAWLRAMVARPLRRRLATFLLAVTVAGAVTAAAPGAGASATAPAPVTATSHFVWTATSANSTGPATFINNLATNNRPGDKLFITHNWTPGGVCVPHPCVDDTFPVGVWYDVESQQWAIINENTLSAMPAGASFNVLVVPAASSSVFTQTATITNTDHNTTYINSSLTNRLPGARLMITPVVNAPNGVTFNDQFTGVVYNPSRRQWGILNEDKTAPMPFDASFNVMVGTANSGGGTSALQTATTTNVNGRITFITHNSLTTGDPNEILFETPNYNPGGGVNGVLDAQPIATYWSPVHGHAAIFNDNTPDMPQVPMPVGASFNLLIYQS
jgi:hypothetical protein